MTESSPGRTGSACAAARQPTIRSTVTLTATATGASMLSLAHTISQRSASPAAKRVVRDPFHSLACLRSRIHSIVFLCYQATSSRRSTSLWQFRPPLYISPACSSSKFPVNLRGCDLSSLCLAHCHPCLLYPYIPQLINKNVFVLSWKASTLR